LFGVEPTEGSTVTVAVPSGPIVVVAGRRFVANVVLSVAPVSVVEPSSTVTPE
jgi:hypothetical protein